MEPNLKNVAVLVSHGIPINLKNLYHANVGKPLAKQVDFKEK